MEESMSEKNGFAQAEAAYAAQDVQELLTRVRGPDKTSVLLGDADFIERLAELSRKNRTGFDTVLTAAGEHKHKTKPLHDAVKRVVGDLEKAEQQQHAKQAEHESAAALDRRRKRLDAIEAVAGPYLKDLAVLYGIGRAMAHRGLVEEKENALLLYLAVLSQITAKPVSVIVKGESSGGKSYLVKKVLELVPRESHIDLTSMSEKA
jgi:hypothetical protein